MHDFQLEAVKKANQSLSQSGKALLIMATGTGKGLVAREIALSFIETGNILIAVELKALVFQFASMFDDLNIKNEILEANRPIADSRSTRVFITTITNLEYISTTPLNFGLVIIIDGYSFRKALLKKLATPYFGTLKKCFISSIDYSEAQQLAGAINFKYDLAHAFENKIFNKVETIAVRGFESHSLNQEEGQRIIADWILHHIYNKRKSKSVIICSNYNTAVNLTNEINGKTKNNTAITITSHNANPYLDIDTFHHSDTVNIAVTINFFYFTNNNKITDIVLLKKMPSQDAFNKALMNCVRSNLSESRVWDFSDNKKYFFEEMGTFRSETLEMRIAGNISRRKLISPLDDRPATVDMLGRMDIVELLDNILTKGSRENLSLALLGNWGMGKSSIITMLKNFATERSGLKIINYNAWHEEHSDNVLSSIANKIIDELYESKNILQQLILNLKSRLISARANFLIELTLLIISIFIISLPIKLSGVISSPAFLTTTILSTIISFIISMIKTYYDSPITKKIRETFKRKNFSDKIGLGQTIKNHLTNLFVSDATSFSQSLFQNKPSKNEKPKYIIAIDDLDRCSDDKIIDTISAVQLLSTIPNVNIILAIDYQVLVKAFMLKWQNQDKNITDEQAIIKSRTYLGKIFQAAIVIDTPPRDKIDLFIHKNLYKNVQKKSSPDISTNSKQAFDNDTDIPFNEITHAHIEDLKILEDSENYELSPDEFLEENYDEYEIFVECARVFCIGNPRTLVRLHNTVTFIKGLNQDIMQSKNDVAIHIFLAFWYETWCSQNDSDKTAMETELISAHTLNNNDKLSTLARNLGIGMLSNIELNMMLNNVIRVSLPFNRVPCILPIEDQTSG